MLAAAAGLSVGASALWHYNRGNFLFDRKLRQEQEFSIFEWRKVHAELWREDVRDIIELTEKKMDNYLIISVLELGMCAGLFATGRMEPGTPPWLLQLYMLTLGAAFTYLIMAVWFAMHATVAAQCASVRMLTQFVRLPIPNWHDFESARTYAHQYETLRVEDTLRVPMLRSSATGDQPSAPRLAQGPGYEDWVKGVRDEKSEASSSTGFFSKRKHPDPWRMEAHGEDRGFYELRDDVSVDMRRHILLARHAAQQYQCYDAFSRLAMSFGTHQLLFAISHFCLAYVSITDGAQWPSWSVVIVMMCSSAMMMHVDFSLTRMEQFWATLLIFVGLIGGAVSVHLWTFAGVRAAPQLSITLPLAYFGHLAWLLSALHACGLKECPSGVLPLKFRAVLYLDVFGWLNRNPAGSVDLSMSKRQQVETPRQPASSTCCGTKESSEPCAEPSPKDDSGRGRSLLQRIFCRRPQERFSLDLQYSPLQHQQEERSRGYRGLGTGTGAGGEIGFPPEHAFDASTFQDSKTNEDFRAMHDDEDIVTGRDKQGPGEAPARLFKRATYMFVILWAVAYILPIAIFKNIVARPMVADIYVEHIDEKTGRVDSKTQMKAVVGTDINGMPMLIPIVPAPRVKTLELSGGMPFEVTWPSHNAFIPRALTCDPNEGFLVVADDFGIYSARLPNHYPNAAEGPAGEHGEAPVLPRSRRPRITFRTAPRCGALEGTMLSDAAIVCSASGEDCAAFVLAEDERKVTNTITACPFWQHSETSDSIFDGLSWPVETDWLEDGEHLRSLGIRSDCLHRSSAAQEFEDSHSCVLAGTTAGRVVELTAPSWRDGSRLVPHRVVVQRNVSSISGSLADLRAGVLVVLWYRDGVIEVLDQAGALIGRWLLPEFATWLMVAGGDDGIYALGVLKPAKEQHAGHFGRDTESHFHAPPQESGKTTTSVLLWKFPVPDVVKELWSKPVQGVDGAEL